jgi:hypothetical protein
VWVRPAQRGRRLLCDRDGCVFVQRRVRRARLLDVCARWRAPREHLGGLRDGLAHAARAHATACLCRTQRLHSHKQEAAGRVGIRFRRWPSSYTPRCGAARVFGSARHAHDQRSARCAVSKGAHAHCRTVPDRLWSTAALPPWIGAALLRDIPLAQWYALSRVPSRAPAQVKCALSLAPTAEAQADPFVLLGNGQRTRSGCGPGSPLPFAARTRSPPRPYLARACGRYCTVVAGLCSTVEVVGVKDLVDDGAQRFGVSVGPCTSGACAQSVRRVGSTHRK